MFRERIVTELANNKQLRKYVRELARCRGKPYPIVVIDGDLPPTIMGRSGYTVPRGRVTGMWRSGGYWARSTKRIEVGSDWLLEVLMTRKFLKVNHDETKENRTA